MLVFAVQNLSEESCRLLEGEETKALSWREQFSSVMQQYSHSPEDGGVVEMRQYSQGPEGVVLEVTEASGCLHEPLLQSGCMPSSFCLQRPVVPTSMKHRSLVRRRVASPP